MFSNFIYFIVALLIITLYEPAEQPILPLPQMLLLLVLLAAAFAFYTFRRFRALRGGAATRFGRVYLDSRYSTLMTRHSIIALALFTIDIWALHLPSYIDGIGLLEALPTLRELILLMLFVAYLVIVWLLAYDAYNEIYQVDIPRGNYVYSNLAFSIPILIPWTLLSGLLDILKLLPFELPKRILDTTAGQIGYFLIFLLIASVFAPLLIRHFWRCRPLAPGWHRHRIEQLCQRAGIRFADIVYWPIFGGRMITAGVMGLIGRFRYIMVTDALLGMLQPEEIDQVIAHEIGHVKRGHLFLYLMFFTGFMLISYAFYPISMMLLFFDGPVLDLVSALHLNPFRLLPSIYAVLLVIGIVVYFRFIFGYFMRNFERQADLFVFRMFPSAQPLIDTFDKIAIASGQPADKPNWHHFSIKQRVDYLRRCQNDPHWIVRHDGKVRRSIATYLLAFVLLAVGVFYMNQAIFGRNSRQLHVADLEMYLAQKEGKTRDDAVLYRLVGDAHYERGDLLKASQAYESSLRLDPDNADVLNNLAWLLSSEKESPLYDPARALALARRALANKKLPHIWDTYAQALFANGMAGEAVAAEKEALAMSPSDRKVYEEQLAKFKTAADGAAADVR